MLDRFFGDAFHTFPDARRRLAAWAKMAASARHDDAPYDCLAAKTGFAVPLINPVPQLKFTAIALGIDIVGDR